MKKILALGASSSSKSINRRLAKYAASLVQNADVNLLDLNDYEMPLYSIDREEAGIPEPALRFKKQIAEADGIIISFAEHNGTYAVAFKNILDWASRIESGLWMNKPMLLLATSPGGRGAIGILKIAETSYSYLNGKVVGALPVPGFFDVFDDKKGLSDKELQDELERLVAKLSAEMAAE